DVDLERLRALAPERKRPSRIRHGWTSARVGFGGGLAARRGREVDVHLAAEFELGNRLGLDASQRDLSSRRRLPKLRVLAVGIAPLVDGGQLHRLHLLTVAPLRTLDAVDLELGSDGHGALLMGMRTPRGGASPGLRQPRARSVASD